MTGFQRTGCGDLMPPSWLPIKIVPGLLFCQRCCQRLTTGLQAAHVGFSASPFRRLKRNFLMCENQIAFQSPGFLRLFISCFNDMRAGHASFNFPHFGEVSRAEGRVQVASWNSMIPSLLRLNRHPHQKVTQALQINDLQGF